MTAEVTIRPCRSAREWRLFERISERLHGHLEHFLPPFPGSVARIRRPGHPFHRHGKIFPLVAYRGPEPVGRIAAIINETHNNLHEDTVGFFGFFDCVDDAQVAHQLFDEAEVIVRANGKTSMRGPYSPTQNDECGLLVEGFEQPPFVLMPYNPEYYIGLYEKLGLQKVRDLLAYSFDDETQIVQRIGRIAERLKRRAQMDIRCVDIRRLDEELKIIEYLFNATLKHEWSFMPATTEDLAFAAKDLRAILDPELVLIAEKNGEPIGFSLTIPNVNEFMGLAKSSSGLMRLLRLGWYVKTRRPKEARVVALGVLPEARNKGVAPAFYLESIRRGIARYASAEISWIQDINTEMHKNMQALGLKKSKLYRIYEKSFTSS